MRKLAGVLIILLLVVVTFMLWRRPPSGNPNLSKYLECVKDLDSLQSAVDKAQATAIYSSQAVKQYEVAVSDDAYSIGMDNCNKSYPH